MIGLGWLRRRRLRSRATFDRLPVDGIVERYRWPVNRGHWMSDAGLLDGRERAERAQ